MKLLELINEYGNLKWEEGHCVGRHNTDSSIATFNRAEEVYDKIKLEIESTVKHEE